MIKKRPTLAKVYHKRCSAMLTDLRNDLLRVKSSYNEKEYQKLEKEIVEYYRGKWRDYCEKTMKNKVPANIRMFDNRLQHNEKFNLFKYLWVCLTGKDRM